MHAGEITNYLDERISELAKSRLPDEPLYPFGQSQYASFMMPRDEMSSHDKGTEKWSGSRTNGTFSDDHKLKNGKTSTRSSDSSSRKASGDSSSKSLPNSMKRAEYTLPPFLSPTLPSAFALDDSLIIPLPLSPTLPGAFQDERNSGSSSPSRQKRKRDDSQPLPPPNKPSKDPLLNKTSRKSPPPPVSTSTPPTKKSVSLNEYKKRRGTVAAQSSPVTPTLPKGQPSYVMDSPHQSLQPDPQTKTKPTDLDAKSFAEISQKCFSLIGKVDPRYLARGTNLKREADKLSRTDQTAAAVTATHAILYFMSAFACDDQSRKLRGKLQLHENWKSTSEFITWVINLLRDNSEDHLEGLCHQLHAICYQRLYDSELRFLRSCHKAFDRQRVKDNKDQVTADDQFWRVWTESSAHYAQTAKAWLTGHSKLSELVLREKYPQTWKRREYWGTECPANEEGEFDAKYRLPLGVETSIPEAVGFAQSVLREFIIERGLKYSMS